MTGEPIQSPGSDDMFVLEARSLVRRFGDKTAVDGVDIRIRDGECYVVMGASGSGKSTLLRLLSGLDTPTEGSVRIEGRDIHTVPQESLPPLSMVFQSAALFNSMTVRDNIALWMTERRVPPAEIESVVRQSLDHVGLDDVETLLPGELSGGMRKRVAIARALAIASRMVFYDEPTSELDPVTAVRIAELIRDLHRRLGKTTLVVTHDRDLAYYLADRMAILAEGRIIVEGPPEEIRASSHPEVRAFLDVRIGQLSSERLR